MSSYSPAGSPSKATDGGDATQDIASGVCGVGLADVLQRFGVAENGERLLELSEVFGADDYGRITAVARDDDPLVLVLDAIDDFGQMISYGPQRLSRHGHNCGRDGPVCQRHDGTLVLELDVDDRNAIAQRGVAPVGLVSLPR